LEIFVTPLMIAALGLLMVATAFLSGLFGMAGGLILIGVLLALMPLPTAMVLHAITQMASNGWRAFLWRAHIRWRPVFVYLIGCAVALALWSITRYVPDKPVALLLLGVTPFMARLTPPGLKPNPDSVWQGTVYGTICMGLMLMTGVSGPLMDTFFLGQIRSPRHRRNQGNLPGGEPFHQADLFRRHHRPGRDARSGPRRRRDRSLDARHHAVAAHSGSHERAAVSSLGQSADHHRCELLHPLWRLASAVRAQLGRVQLTERGS
jgi:hypothetical protein